MKDEQDFNENNLETTPTDGENRMNAASSDPSFDTDENGAENFGHENGDTAYGTQDTVPDGGADTGTDPFSNMSAETETNDSHKNEPKKHRFPVWQIAVAAVAFGLVAATVFQFTSLWLSKLLLNHDKYPYSSSEKIKVANTYVTANESSAGGEISDVVAEVMPAMVSINVVSTVQANNGIFSYEYEAEGAGSGVIFADSESSLFILTNYHVISGAKSIAVSFVDNTAYYVSVKGYDEATDLAVLEIKLSDMKPETRSAIAIAVLGKSENLKLGERVIAIGNALGYGQTVTVGYVSALDRSVQDEDGYVKSMIQTDAAINAGNSGGALINARGEVVGINSMKNITANTDNIGYAIPIDTVNSVASEILTRTVYDSKDMAYLGISGVAVKDAYFDYATRGMPVGIYITDVKEQLPAANAGLQIGDIITAFDGKSIAKMTTLQTYLSYKTSGDTVTLTVARRKATEKKYETVTVTVELISKRDAGVSE